MAKAKCTKRKVMQTLFNEYSNRLAIARNREREFNLIHQFEVAQQFTEDDGGEFARRIVGGAKLKIKYLREAAGEKFAARKFPRCFLFYCFFFLLLLRRFTQFSRFMHSKSSFN